eukprot:1025336-Pelagomonas_calceolata.AAC.7
MAHAGLGAVNVCNAASASQKDALLPCLSGKRVTTLVIAITQLLSDAHPLILRAVLVRASIILCYCPDGSLEP